MSFAISSPAASRTRSPVGSSRSGGEPRDGGGAGAGRALRARLGTARDRLVPRGRRGDRRLARPQAHPRLGTQAAAARGARAVAPRNRSSALTAGRKKDRVSRDKYLSEVIA